VLRRLTLGGVAVVASGMLGCSGSSRPMSDTADVSGTVVEEVTFAPIAGAEVSIGEERVRSASDGTFTLTGVESGAQTLAVSAAGYEPYTKSVTLANGANAVGQLWLKRATDAGVVPEDAAVAGWSR
jgi:hypothetical protein